MKKILIFRTGQLGDALIALPSLHAIYAESGVGELVLLYDRHIGKEYVVSEALFRGAPLFSDFWGYPVGYSRREKLFALWELLRLLLRIRRGGFDCVVHLEPELKTHPRLRRDKLFFRLAGIRKQVTTLEYRHPRSPVRPLEPLEHESDFFLRALGEQGFDVPRSGEGCMDLGLGEQENKEVRQWMAPLEGGRAELEDGRWKEDKKESETAGKGHQTPESPESQIASQLPSSNSHLLPPMAVGIGVGSKMQSKRWPLERYREVLQRLIESHNIQPVFFGGPEDAEAANALIEELGCGLNACGQLSLRGSARALQGCQFYLGNDTGTMHLAVASGIKCVAIFSARDVPGKWYPYGDGHFVHRIPVDCEGCLLYECHEEGRRCLMAIQPEEVYQSCVELLHHRHGSN